MIPPAENRLSAHLSSLAFQGELQDRTLDGRTWHFDVWETGLGAWSGYASYLRAVTPGGRIWSRASVAGQASRAEAVTALLRALGGKSDAVR